jgi:hypothetical protein
MEVAPLSSARPLGPNASSAAAAEAEAAVAAAAAVQPRVKTLMALSSAKPSGHNTLLGGAIASSGISSSSGKVCNRSSKYGEARRDSDTALMRDVRPELRKEQRGGQDGDRACILDSAGSSSSQAEAELVSTACLALQGVWSGVEALWGLVLSQQSKAQRPDRLVPSAEGARKNGWGGSLLVLLAVQLLAVGCFTHGTGSKRSAGGGLPSSPVSMQLTLCLMQPTACRCN